MNRFNNYITSLVLIFATTTTIIANWVVPHLAGSSSHKATVFLFLLSVGLMTFHFLRHKFKKIKLQNAFKDGYKVKLVKEILGDSPKTLEKFITMPFLPMKNMYIQDGFEREFVQGLQFDPNEDFITLFTNEDDRCTTDDLKMREIISEYTSRGWKTSKQ